MDTIIETDRGATNTIKRYAYHNHVMKKGRNGQNIGHGAIKILLGSEKQ
jgi:hypothetical protein